MSQTEHFHTDLLVGAVRRSPEVPKLPTHDARIVDCEAVRAQETDDVRGFDIHDATADMTLVVQFDLVAYDVNLFNICNSRRT